MDKLNINVVDASQAAEGVTTHVLGIADDGSLKKVEVTPSLSDTYSREAIDSKDAANKAYTDQQISELIGGATPEQLDTLKELGDALTQSGDAIVAINGKLSTKYGPDNKPTPSDLGVYSKHDSDRTFVKQTGGTVSGNLTVGGNLNVGSSKLLMKGINIAGADGGVVRLGDGDGASSMNLNAKDGVINVNYSGNSFRAYHQGFKPTATDVGTAPIIGDSTSQLGFLNFIATNYSLGYCMYPDLDFANGSNSVTLYNNRGGTGLVHEYITDNTAPNNSKRVLRMKHDRSQAISPGAGGFITIMPSAANKIFVQVFVAKLDRGLHFVPAENPMGGNSKTYWATSNAGTGKWERYIRVTMCGDSGDFSGGGHTYVLGGSGITYTYIAECTCYDITKVAIPYTKYNKPTAADIGLGNVPNLVHTPNVATDTVVVRDGVGDINCRLLKSNFPNDSGSYFKGAIAYRVNDSNDNYLRFCDDKGAIKKWLGVTATEAGALPITGGNLTGPLTTVGNSVSYRGLTVHNSSDGWSYMALHSKGTEAHIAHTNKSESGAAANSLHLRPMGGQNGSLMLQPNAPMIHLTSFGNITIGSANTEWAHFNTDRPKFHFGKPIAVLGEIYAGGSYNQRVYHQGFKPTPAEIGALSYNSSTLNGNDATVAYGRQGLQVSNLSGTGGNGTNGVYLSNPTNDWYYHLTQNHANNGGYYFDIASSFHSDSIYFRRVANGSDSGWSQLYHTKFKPTPADIGAQPAGSYAASSHRHPWSDLDGVPATATRWPTTSEAGALDRFSALQTFGDGSVITTDQFLTILEQKGAFNKGYWAGRGTWYYAGNSYVNTGIGTIHLAGAVVEVWGDQRGDCTIKVTLPTTQGGQGTHTHREFTYINNGPSYNPGWRADFNTASGVPWYSVNDKPATATRWPTPAEIGLGNVVNKGWNYGIAADTYAVRDGNGDLVARQFHGTHVGDGYNLTNLQWSRLVGVPATASRWPTWGEIGGKPPSIGSDTGWINIPMTAKTGTNHVIGNRKTMRYRVLNGIIYFDFQIVFLDAKTTVAYTRLPNWHYGEKYIAGTGSGDRGGGSESKLFKITAAGDIYNAVEGGNQYHVVTGLNPTPVD